MRSSDPPLPPPSPARGNGVGVTGFIVGMLGLLLAPTPLIGMFAWPLVIAGLVLSGIALRRALGGGQNSGGQNSGGQNKGLSIAGLACSVVGLVFCLGTTYDYAARPAAADSYPQDSQPQDGPAGGIGDPVRDGMFEFTVTEVETGVDHVANGFLRSDAEGQYVIVHVTVRNVGSDGRTLSMSAQRLHDARGRTYPAGDRAAMMAMSEPKSFPSTISPGETVDAELLFDVPAGVVLATLELHDTVFSDGTIVSLR